MFGIKSGEMYHCQKPLARILVQLLQSEMGKYPVLPHHGHEIRGYAHDKKVEQWDEAVERYPVLLRICLDKLEAHPAAGKVIERITAVGPFRIQHGDSRRQIVLRKMVVADNHINAPVCRIEDLVVGLNAAVKSDYQAEAVVRRPVYSLV